MYEKGQVRGMNDVKLNPPIGASDDYIKALGEPMDRDDPRWVFPFRDTSAVDEKPDAVQVGPPGLRAHED